MNITVLLGFYSGLPSVLHQRAWIYPWCAFANNRKTLLGSKVIEVQALIMGRWNAHDNRKFKWILIAVSTDNTQLLPQGGSNLHDKGKSHDLLSLYGRDLIYFNGAAFKQAKNCIWVKTYQWKNVPWHTQMNHNRQAIDRNPKIFIFDPGILDSILTHTSKHTWWTGQCFCHSKLF